MRKILTGLAITVAVTAIATTANAASTACGSACISLSTLEYGPGFITSASTAATAGEPVSAAASGPDASEDFQADYIGTGAQAYSEGFVTAEVGRTWPTAPVYQFIFTPGGRVTDLCIGVAVTAGNGTGVTLQSCEAELRTMWVAMPNHSSNVYYPLINGTDLSTSDPQVLRADAETGQLTTDPLFTVGGTAISPDEMWRALSGIARVYPILRR
jgi:hypothetical protein